MENILYAPWRDEYVTNKKIKGCVFCHISEKCKDDKVHPEGIRSTANGEAREGTLGCEDLHVLYRDKHCFIVMNKYPYTPGHFMIIPHVHTDKLEELDGETWLHMSALAQKCVRLLKEGFNAPGVNIGMNLGKAGGAGIAEHIHMHLVPRWERDTNFITAIADTRVYSTDFEKIYKKIKSLLPKYI